jgi:hypothetical protein
MNNQTTIDTFFTSKINDGKECYIKRYFYLDWSNSTKKPDEDAHWLYHKPKKINFQHKINCDFIKKGFYFYICGFFEDYELDEYNLIKEKKYKNLSFLKSHLQKNIRIQDDQKALPTALHLMQLDLNELLRRMSIIHLEDTFLHQSWITLIWLTIAKTKNFKMKKYIIEWLLGFVYMTCKTKKKDDETKKIKGIDTLKSYKNIYDEFNDYHNMELNKIQESMLYSMHIRCAYGGMGCDIIMIKKFILLWKTRFLNRSICVLNNMNIVPISIHMNDLSLEEWDLRSIDFHTYSKFNEFILKKYPQLENLDIIKKIIWIHNSGTNKRNYENESQKKIRNYKIEEWKLIKPYVKKMQHYLLICYH